MNMRQSTQRGIALVEAMIATVILAIGLLGTIGLQARAYSAMNDASSRAEATMASEKLFGMMSTDMEHLSNYVLAEGGSGGTEMSDWVTETHAAIPGSKIAVSVKPASNGTTSTAVTVTIKWQRKARDPANTSTMTSYLATSS
ncbi:type IV pilus modification PilV family protein [Massilia sp. S19_KUP03_FR1]|uniref:type IV pilus modification PilV family protein n=1 Tax=Massilia sp. S19_KUP03_FR1 TaxID=3025503 RepID=UPI002FCDD31A